MKKVNAFSDTKFITLILVTLVILTLFGIISLRSWL